jgi:hypothetical protein
MHFVQRNTLKAVAVWTQALNNASPMRTFIQIRIASRINVRVKESAAADNAM